MCEHFLFTENLLTDGAKNMVVCLMIGIIVAVSKNECVVKETRIIYFVWSLFM